MTFGSLFSGIGGLDLGLERAGMTCVWQCEIDPFCRRVLEKHWPNVSRYSDVRDFTSNRYVDLICGGFPCQPVSVAGLRKGVDDERWLWPEFARVIGLVRPSYVLVENVPNLLVANSGRAMGQVLGDLASLGYDAEWDCISAKDIGAPHKRERLFIVAHPSQMGPATAFATANGNDDNHKEQDCKAYQYVGLAEQPRVDENACLHASDNRSERVQRIIAGQVSWSEAFSWCKNVRRVEDLRGRSDIPEPLFRGTCDGIPQWMDRIGSIGNAVVPQVAETIGRMILEAERVAEEPK